jgi:hypothetical protein
MSSHVRYWQHQRMTSSPARSRVWQAWHCGSPTSTTLTPVYLKLTTTTTANSTANFLWLNNNIDHNNINPIDFICGDYITNDTIDRDYNTPSFMATSATRATTLPPTYALVRPFASLPIRLWRGRVRVYHSFAIFDSLIL